MADIIYDKELVEEILSEMESLLSLTESFVDELAPEGRDLWLNISAKTADLREEMDNE